MNLAPAFSLTIILVAAAALPALAQKVSSTSPVAVLGDSANGDSTSTNEVDTTNADSSAAKSPIKPVDIGLDSGIEYSAREFENDRKRNIIHLRGDAKVKYKEVTIEAGKITIKLDENLLIAEGLPDTTKTDSLALARGDTSLVDLPLFSDGREKMVGERMEFNFKSEKGRILRGRTEFQKGYYQGRAVKRVNENVFNVVDGLYSSCDKQEPHFHFRGKRMKVILNDKVIAKPVILYLGKIPLAIAPFAMFSTEEDGRQSGVILPQYGSSPTEGRYLRDLGYYWATNDYTDARLTVDFYDRTGVLFKSNVNYALRYKFTGSVSGSFTRKNFGTRKERRWNLDVRHNQTIDPTMSLAVDASFVSNNSFYREFSSNRDQRLNRQIRSNATFRKNWSGSSFTMNLSQTKDIETGRSTTTLPQINFSKNQVALIPHVKKERMRAGEEDNPQWYNFLRYNYRASLLNTVQKDSTNDNDADVNRRVEHSLSFSYTNPNKFFGWLSWNQSLNYDEDWFERVNTFAFDSTTNRVTNLGLDRGFFTRRTFSYSTSAQTNVYGTFAPKIGPVRALRHKMSPSIQFSYMPDFSSDFWGYYETFTDTLGTEIRRDRFGGTPQGDSRSLNFRLSNLFQMKLFEGEKEKRIDLFNLDFSSSYNFAADSLKLGNLNTTFRANPARTFNVDMGMTHSFYEFDMATSRLVDRLLMSQNGLLNALRLTRLSLNASWRLGGKSSQPQGVSNTPAGAEPGAPLVEDDQGFLDRSRTVVDDLSPDAAFSAFEIPWRANLTFSYALNKPNPLTTQKTAYLDLSNVEMQLTKNWRVGYRLRYDIVEKDIVDQRLSFHRDLHCWEAQFNWSPSGIYKGFYFKINVKAPHLQSLKYEKRGGTSSVFSPY